LLLRVRPSGRYLGEIAKSGRLEVEDAATAAGAETPD